MTGGEERSEQQSVGNGHAKNSVDASAKIFRDVNMQKIRDKASRLKGDVISDLDGRLGELLDEFVHEVEKVNQSPTVNGSGLSSRPRKKGELPDKEFIARRSVLTELLEISHIRTIYHIFVAILIVFSLNTVVCDFIDKGRLVLDFDLITWTFGKFPTVMWLWMCMSFSTTVVVYPLFQFWTHSRTPGPVYWMDYVWLSLYIFYQLAFLIIPVHILLTNQLPPASSVIIVTEQVRLLMKCHAFVRENIPKALKWDVKKNDGDSSQPCPDFSSYLYFLFAPTLVYRDNYPRTPGPIRWNNVVSNFGQVLACLFFTYYIFERFCVPVFRNFNQEHVSPRQLILTVFGSMMPGTLVLFIAFFAILHSWLNAFAEMLRFADRLFYKDWWNSSSFANYYRTWNLVVHDWLYCYVYKEIYKVFGSNRPAAMSGVFLLSAVFHEYILSIAFGFFYPVLLVMFAGVGFAFIFLPNKGAPRSGNVFMWVALFIGNGLLMTLYSMEWYARKNCPDQMGSFFDLMIPRSWTCDFSRIKAPVETVM